MDSKHTARVLPYRYYFIPVLVLVLLGLADTTYLAVSHYRNYTDIAYSSFCALSKAINCDTVSQSPWSILFGLPVAIWGFFGYLLYGLLLINVTEKSPQNINLWSLLFILGLLYSGAAVYFGYVSATKIHAYCIMCIASYGISFSLLLYAWIIRRRFDTTGLFSSLARALHYIATSPRIITGILVLLICMVGLKISMPRYWTYSLPTLTQDIHTGTTEDLSPWIGAENPILTIEEYSDYQCFQCYKMHFMLRGLIAQYPDKIRLIHRHFPMDNTVNEIIVPTPFHVGAGKMAMMAIYAMFKDKFWRANDVLFALGRAKKTFNTRRLSEKTGIPSGEFAMATRNAKIHLLLQRDIRQGMKLGITGTPTFVIAGKVYPGSIPAEILDKVVQ